MNVDAWRDRAEDFADTAILWFARAVGVGLGVVVAVGSVFGFVLGYTHFFK